MAEALNAKSYLALLKKSGIVAEDKLKASLGRLAASANGQAIKTQQLSEHILSEGLITSWQNDQLMAGRHKGFFLGKYRLLRLLGAGGMSAVYLAQHTITKHLRAIKVLPKSRIADKTYLERFYLEGRAAASLRHPNIAQIVDLDNEGDIHFMVMEYVDGVDLEKKIRAEGPLTIGAALEYLRQSAEGLKHAHSRNIIHRDIKPANLILTTATNQIKILDLGLALVQNNQESLTVLHDEKVMGTADYLSPEQAIDSHKVDQRADIYSLGCTLYFMIVGHPPFPEGTIAQRVAKHQTVDPPELTSIRSDCPVQVSRLCQMMMNKKPSERFADCDVLLQALRKVNAALTLTNSPSGDAAKVNSKSPPALSPEVARTAAATPVNDRAKAERVSAAPAMAEAKQAAKPVKNGPTVAPKSKPAGNIGQQLQGIEAAHAVPTAQSGMAIEIPDSIEAVKRNEEVGDLSGLADLDSGASSFALGDLAFKTVASPATSRRTANGRKSNSKSVIIVGAIVGLMFLGLMVVLYFLTR
ncbi:MAG: protein kinase [Pirellulaceae bacterium]